MKIIIKNLQCKFRVNLKKIKITAAKTLGMVTGQTRGEITVCLMNDRQIREFNLYYLGDDGPTDVISFAINRSPRSLIADIAISVETAARNARQYQTSTMYELYLYAVHGILHLFNYDDRSLPAKQKMDKKTAEILSQLKHAHP